RLRLSLDICAGTVIVIYPCGGKPARPSVPTRFPPLRISGMLMEIKGSGPCHSRLAYRATMVKATSWHGDSRAATKVNKFACLHCAPHHDRLAWVRGRVDRMRALVSPPRSAAADTYRNTPEPRHQMDIHKPRYTPMSRRRRIYEGKAKVLYEGPEPGTLIQHFKDDATAFNAKKHQVIEGKGVLNNRISEYVF